jgi:hypothetical protein
MTPLTLVSGLDGFNRSLGGGSAQVTLPDHSRHHRHCRAAGPRGMPNDSARERSAGPGAGAGLAVDGADRAAAPGAAAARCVRALADPGLDTASTPGSCWRRCRPTPRTGPSAPRRSSAFPTWPVTWKTPIRLRLSQTAWASPWAGNTRRRRRGRSCRGRDQPEGAPGRRDLPPAPERPGRHRATRPVDPLRVNQGQEPAATENRARSAAFDVLGR